MKLRPHLFRFATRHLAPDPDPAGAAGGAGAGGDPPPGGGGGGGAPTGAPPPKTFTQEQVDQIVRDRVARVKAGGEATTPPTPKQQAQVTSTESKADPTQTLMDFQDYMDSLEGVKVPLGLKKRMRADFMAAKPPDPDAWGSAWLADVGIKPGTTQTTTTAQQAAGEQKSAGATTVTTPPISDKGAAQGVREFEQITNPRDLTKDDIERLQAKHGEDKANEMIREMARKYLRGKKFVPGQ